MFPRLCQLESLWIWVVMFFLGVNCLTTELYPSVWMDEVMFSDPAANQFFGRGFTSTTGAFQDKDAFNAQNAPLHPLLLDAWYRCFGFGLYQTRWFSYLLWTAAVMVLCMAVRRLRWVTTAKGLACLAALAFLGMGVTFAYRTARYEPLAVLVAALGLLAFSAPQPRWRYAGIFAACALFLPVCLTLGPFFVMTAALVLLVTRGRFWRELIVASLGLAVGMGFVWAFYQHFGAWDDFLRAIHGNTQTYYNSGIYQNAPASLGAVAARKFHDAWKVVFGDRDSVILMLVAVAAIFLRRKEFSLPHRPVLWFAALAFFGIPLGLLAAYAFPTYYWWMRYLPVCLGFVIVMENVHLPGGAWLKNVVVIACLLAVSWLGLPGRIAFAADEYPAWDYARVEEFTRQSVHEGDVVYADYQVFYPMQKMGVTAYYWWYLAHITPTEAASINCLIISPKQFDYVHEKLGGEWVATGEHYGYEQKFRRAWLNRLMPHYFLQRTTQKYDLTVYRKTGDAPAGHASSVH